MGSEVAEIDGDEDEYGRIEKMRDSQLEMEGHLLMLAKKQEMFE